MQLLFSHKLSNISESTKYTIMKKLKKIDFWVSVILIAFFISAGIISLFTTNFFPLAFAGYFVVGGWQAISMAVHAYNHWFTYNKDKRYIYHWVTAIMLITMPVGSYIILLFISPFMAIFYAWVCYEEVYIKMRRPLALLK